SRLLRNGNYADLIVTCSSDTYNVHKAVVCARSGFFERAERFPVGKESVESRIDLPEDDPATIKLLIEYLYEAEYDPRLPDSNESSNVTDPVKPFVKGPKDADYHYNFPHTCQPGCPTPHHMVCPHHECGERDGDCDDDCVDFICTTCCGPKILPAPTGDATQLVLHAKMYEIGDKYHVLGLKQLAREKFIRASAVFWDSEHFGSAIHHAYSTTPEEDKGLRVVVTEVIAQHMELLNKPAIETLAKEFNGLAFGLLKAHTKAFLKAYPDLILLTSGEYSDLVITCGSDRYNVHKAIVCPQSGFFQRAEKFPVGKKESAEGEIQLPQDDPVVVKLLIAFLYDGEYDPALPPKCALSPDGVWALNAERKRGYHYSFPHTCLGSGNCSHPIAWVCPHHVCGGSTCDQSCKGFVCNECVGPTPPEGDASQLLLHAKMYEIGDKYDISSLKELSRHKFALGCRKHWNDELFFAAAQHALATTPESDQGLRRVLQETVAQNPELLEKSSTEALCNSYASFAYGVLKVQAEQIKRLKKA
ncbi:hypothetical protein FB567DRAFT_436686, partial [Paraphoma chrysanthemicola]